MSWWQNWIFNDLYDWQFLFRINIQLSSLILATSCKKCWMPLFESLEAEKWRYRFRLYVVVYSLCTYIVIEYMFTLLFIGQENVPLSPSCCSCSTNICCGMTIHDNWFFVLQIDRYTIDIISPGPNKSFL